MLKTITNKSAARRIVVPLLIGGYILSLSEFAGAFGHDVDNTVSEAQGSCQFSLQLQKSVSARREYMVKVDEAVFGVGVAANAVEEMYDNIRPAALSDEEEYQPGRRGGLSSVFRKRSGDRVLGVDDFSKDCVSCHDGANASSIPVNLRDKPLGRKPQITSFKTNHPIGMTYDHYVSAKRGYKPIGDNTRMVFVNGKVGCLTCHDPLNPEKGHLVMSDRGSALCLTCHDK